MSIHLYAVSSVLIPSMGRLSTYNWYVGHRCMTLGLPLVIFFFFYLSQAELSELEKPLRVFFCRKPLEHLVVKKTLQTIR